MYRIFLPSPHQEIKKLGLRVSKADFGPSIWGERFVSYTLADDIARGHKEQQAEDLKEEVRRGLMAAADIFNKFKDEKGGFQESLINDVRGILGLYEATHLRVHEEGILDEAFVFTTTHLESVVEHLEYPLAEQVTHSLKQPVRKGLNRLEARLFISIYQHEASHDKALLKLAKLDFNLSRSPTPVWGFVWLRKGCLSVWPRNPMGHNEDVVSAWGGICNVPHRIGEQVPGAIYVEAPLNQIPFARDRLVESYFFVLAMFSEPQYSRPKWDESNSQPPEYMEVIYQVLLDVYKEIEEEMDKEGKANCFHYAKEAIRRLPLLNQTVKLRSNQTGWESRFGPWTSKMAMGPDPNPFSLALPDIPTQSIYRKKKKKGEDTQITSTWCVALVNDCGGDDWR
ncbi:(-)-germacrene D synthase [Vitis vinifera]|uniref:(-)-germacrene D synthase n=1 Tax=Vitis vinifera TaxID=29760 RepID=A0A438HEQ1_VITVI|nr:(-)-germacrene D synthase [Vitis vinifera]